MPALTQATKPAAQAAHAPQASKVEKLAPAAARPSSAKAAEPLPEPPAARRAPPSVGAARVGGPRWPRGEKPLASPAVRLAAREANVDLRHVPGAGPAGRITHGDLEAYIAGPPGSHSARATRQPNLSIESIKVIGLRRRIAEAMAESSRRIAHFSYVEEVDVTPLEELRATLNAQSTADKPKLTILPFLILAMVKACADFPQMNAHYDDDNEVIQRFGTLHLGVATQTTRGLMVPVVRHAETLSLHECAHEMRRVTEAAREGVASREELSGSTITLTSLGALGGIVSTPIINRPEVAIVGVNRIAVRPVWRDGSFVPRKTMNLSSSFDHRVVDGHDAATFIQRIRALVEAPATLFIEA